MKDNCERKFACVNCGRAYEAYPPNDRFNTALPQQCENSDCIEIKYECENCHKLNPIFWDKKHYTSRIVKTRGYGYNSIR